jgi:hypothetical protein
MYIPPSQTINNQYTRGDKFYLDGKDYVGDYWTLKTNGRSFTGKDPQTGDNKFLSISSTETPPDFSYDDSNKNFQTIQNAIRKSLNEFPPQITNNIFVRYTPFPYVFTLTDQDKNQTTVTRYFAKPNKKNNSNFNSFFEINKIDYNKIKSRDRKIAWDLYSIAAFPWQINGEISSVFLNNKNTIINIQSPSSPKHPEGKNWKGFLEYFKNNFIHLYQGKFNDGVFKINNKRYYLDLSLIPEVFPPSYQLGRMKSHLNQNCDNCLFYNNNFCNKWKANVESNYWCKSHKIADVSGYQSKS